VPAPDFLKTDLAYECKELAGEVNKLYQRMNLAGKNAAVDRLRRKVNRLAELVEAAQKEKSASRTSKRIDDAVQIVHECVPLMDLNLKSLLLSEDLHKRWIRRLDSLEARLKDWSRAV
jgi:outer membrane murein-binding lipoprotein Lpp